jgi:hypothetical protein
VAALPDSTDSTFDTEDPESVAAVQDSAAEGEAALDEVAAGEAAASDKVEEPSETAVERARTRRTRTGRHPRKSKSERKASSKSGHKDWSTDNALPPGLKLP